MTLVTQKIILLFVQKNDNNYIMEKKICTVCKKRFTRQWNLARHLKDIHNISDYVKMILPNKKMIGLCIHLYAQLRTSLLEIPTIK